MIAITTGHKSLGCRTIDPSEGWDFSKGVLTLYNFSGYRSSKHSVSADVSVLDKTESKVLVKVESLDWVRGVPGPYKTQGCFLFQASVEKYGKIQTYVDRVPCSCETLSDAIEWLKPAEVKKTENSGGTVHRQGDFFFIPMKARSNFSALEDTDHKVVETKAGVSIQHGEHKALPLSGKWKAIQRKTMNHIKAD